MALKLMTDGITDISAAADGALYNFKTNGDWVFRGIGSEFTATYSNTARLVTIGNGEGVCGGRHITEKKIGDSNSQITLPANSSGYLTIRMEPGADPDCYLWAGSELRHDDLNNGGTIRALPLYAYVTTATGITSFIDIRPRSAGNGFILRLEADGEVYADYIFNGQKRHRKILTKTVDFLKHRTFWYVKIFF